MFKVEFYNFWLPITNKKEEKMKKSKLLAALLLCMTVAFPLKAYSYDKVFSGTYEKISLPSQDWSEGQIGAGKSAIVEAGTKFINNKANGILNNSGNLIVNENTLFENNTANGSGGAISTIAATDINNAKFINNSTLGDGGAVRIDVPNNMSDNQVNISNSVFNGNKATGTTEYTDADSGAISIRNGIVNISSSRFKNNEGIWGGAIYAYTGNTAGVQVTIDDCLFEGNKAKAVGAVGNFASTRLLSTGGMTIKNTVFRNNQATDANDDGGGAMFLGSESKTYIDNVIFENNISASTGGAIATRTAGVADDLNNNSAAILQISNSTFKGNVAATNGGAIDNYFYHKDNFIKNTIFDGNKAANGGAIYNHGELDLKGNKSKLNVVNGSFVNNQATVNGGAIYNGAVANITGEFIGNSAAANGGAIYSETAMEIKDSSFLNNTASGKGGAIFANDDLKIAAVAKDVIFSGNTAASGSDIFMNTAGSTLTLNAAAGKSIIVAGGIDGNENGYEIKINDSTISTFALRAARATSSTGGTVVINSPIQNATVNVTDGTLHLAQGSALTGSTKIFMASDTTLNTVDNQINTFNSNVIYLANDTNLIVDLDLGTGKADNYSNAVLTPATVVKVVAINPLGNNTTSNNVSVNILDAMGLDPNAGNVTISDALQRQTQTVLTPIRYLQGSVSSSGVLTMAPAGNSYKDFNPAVMASSVAAQLGGYLTQLNSYDQAFRNMDMYMLMTKKQRQALKLRNKYAAADGNLVFAPLGTQYDDKAVWFRPYASFENVPLKNGPRVSNVAYGSFFGADSELYDLGHGWDGMLSVYAGYNGSHQAYDGISVYQNGGTLGLTGIAYKGNFFTGITLNAGANAGEANTAYGHDNFSMLMAGIANKTGYNIELADGKFIIQPNLQLSYSFVNTFDYRNAAGVKINADPLHAIQVEPGIKFIGNLKNGWQPYAGISVVGNIMDQTNFRANNVSLPELSVKPYVRYGLGVRKTWGEICSGFLQTYFTNGGRNGVGLQAGFRFTLGKGGFDSIKANDKLPEKPKTTISLKGVK